MTESKKIPTILQVLPRLNAGGVERGTLEIAEAIISSGMRALVASEGGTLVPHVNRLGATHIAMPLASKNPWTMWRNVHRLARLMHEQNVSLVHARSRAPAWSAYFAAKKLGIPFITTFHGVYNIENKNKHRYNSIMTRGVKVIAVSDFVRQHILANYPCSAENIICIHRGVDFKIFSPEKVGPDRLIQLTKTWRIPDEPVKIILVPGRITRIKGHSVLLKALKELGDIPFLCVIMGSDMGHETYSEELENFIKTEGLEGRVRLAENTQFMAEAYTLADMVVIPSLQPESFGRVAVEAQAMGKLVIAFDHGGVRETVLPNETGYLVPVGDVRALAEAIRYGLERDDATVRAMADFAVKHARDHFSITRMKNATITLYKDVLGIN